ncbi:MAG: DUF3145 domain-containing protein [Actinomycetota bacterium]
MTLSPNHGSPRQGCLARGTILVHSAPTALCPHVEWALADVLGAQPAMTWTRQFAEPGMWRAEIPWHAEVGTGARLASALRSCVRLRYEVVEEPSESADGARWSHTPTLGVHHSIVGVHGDVLVGEEQLRAVLEESGTESLKERMLALLGAPWDDELEPFRYAGEGAPVRWLTRVG